MHPATDHIFTLASAVAGAVAVVAEQTGNLDERAGLALLFTIVVGFAGISAHQLIGKLNTSAENTTRLLVLVEGKDGVLERLKGLEERERDRLVDAAHTRADPFK